MHLKTPRRTIVELGNELFLSIPKGEHAVFSLGGETCSVLPLIPYLLCPIRSDKINLNRINNLIDLYSQDLKEIVNKKVYLPTLYGRFDLITSSSSKVIAKKIKEVLDKEGISLPVYVNAKDGFSTKIVKSSDLYFCLSCENSRDTYWMRTDGTLGKDDKVVTTEPKGNLSALIDENEVISIDICETGMEPYEQKDDTLIKIYNEILKNRIRKDNSNKIYFSKINSLFEVLSITHISLFSLQSTISNLGNFNRMLTEAGEPSIKGSFSSKDTSKKEEDIHKRLIQLYKSCMNKVLANLATLGIDLSKIKVQVFSEALYHGVEAKTSLDFTKYDYKDANINYMLCPLEKVLLDILPPLGITTKSDLHTRILTMHMYMLGLNSLNNYYSSSENYIKATANIARYSPVTYGDHAYKIASVEVQLTGKDMDNIYKLLLAKINNPNYNTYDKTKQIYITTSAVSNNISINTLLTSMATILNKK